MTDPTVPNVIVAIAIFLGCCLGILVTLMWTWNKDEAELDQLAAENRQLRKRLAATLCRYRAKSQANKSLQKFVDRNWYGEVGDVDEYLMRDRSAE